MLVEKKDKKKRKMLGAATRRMIILLVVLILVSRATDLKAQASVSGYAWIDENQNGIQDASERGFSGLLVQLYRQTTPSQSEQLSSLRTESSGHFLFILSGDILPADLYLQFEPAPGFFFTLANQGENEAKDSDANQATGRTAMFRLQNYDNANDLGAGYTEEAVSPPPPPPPQQADLSLIELADKPQVHIGDTLRYSITIKNAGPDTAHQVIATLPYSAAVSILSADPPPALLTDNPLRWEWPWLAPDSTMNITVLGLVIDDGGMEESACVSSASFDPNTSDNCQYYLVDIQVPVELASFAAQMRNDGVHLEWTTQSESENMGFHLLRADSPDGLFRRITDRMIQGNGTTAIRHQYRYVDAAVEKDRTYYYQLRDFDYAGRSASHGPLQVNTALPQNFDLLQNYPNPFNATTRIEFLLPEPGQVTLTVYNTSGELVRSLVSAQLPAGRHQAVWDGIDERGNPAASGLYFCSLSVNGFQSVRRMQMIK